MDGFNNLEENIESAIYEGLLKLGYADNESFSIYYDLDLLNHLLETEFISKQKCLAYLDEFKTFADPRFFNLIITLEGGRFKFTVPAEGITYISDKNKDNHFLQNLIKKVNTHQFTLEDILDIFDKYTPGYICEEADHPEYKYIIYFKDRSLDKFKYCFNFDVLGNYYHRLIEFSYLQSLHEHEN
ncbi:hypothetical protein acsn021_34550 [Anaerocolumna cellulosilytica]|uniref:Uncharacterized protein n=1 Tax=Anaerocolumna cellulosilytica TaxID=433286 RepID=A0A6S6R1D7_9FIRM|nr:DUF3877 family protein [Anaerocolumna cellulosilytica]MBB5195353.1 hypothetical protein [Anaerocolumna cellulosilytica]BCJ95886.1 hypothetical protein acsn021_34550 [Anaerocolumna cellulosilytica]